MGNNAGSLFRETLDAMPDHIAVLDNTGRIVFVNLAWKNFADQNGFQAENYGLGLNYVDICQKAAGPSAEVAEEIAKGLKEVLSGKKNTCSYEYPFHTPFQNRSFRVNISGFPLDSDVRVVVTHQNITRRKQHEKDMKFMSLAVDSTEDCVYWIRPDGSIRYVNKSALKQTGYSSEEVIGLKVKDIDLYVDEESWKSTWQRLKQQKVLRFETVHVTKNGRHIPFEVTANYLRINENEEYNFAVARNIRDRKQAERQIRKLSQAVAHSPASVVITDIHGTIEYVNRKFSDVTGYAYNEVIGENPRILRQEQQNKENYKKL